MELETKIYVMRDENTPDFDWMNPDNFEDTIDYIEEQGDVYSLDGFIEAFNDGDVSSFTDTIFKLEHED